VSMRPVRGSYEGGGGAARLGIIRAIEPTDPCEGRCWHLCHAARTLAAAHPDAQIPSFPSTEREYCWRGGIRPCLNSIGGSAVLIRPYACRRVRFGVVFACASER